MSPKVSTPTAAFARPLTAATDEWRVEIHFRAPPDETAVRALAALAAGETIAAALSVRTSRAGRLGGGKSCRLAAGRGRALRGAWRARSRACRGKPHRHRDRGGARLRHRASRHHARMPAGAGRSGEATAARATCSTSAPAPACWQLPRRERFALPRHRHRYRSTGGRRRARQRAAQPRRGDDFIRPRQWLQRPLRARPRALRSHPGQHPAGAADAHGRRVCRGSPRAAGASSSPACCPATPTRCCRSIARTA